MWRRCKRDTLGGYEEFVAAFPDSPLAARVRALIAVGVKPSHGDARFRSTRPRPIGRICSAIRRAPMWPMRSAASRGSRLPMIRRRPSCRWPLPRWAAAAGRGRLSQPAAIVFDGPGFLPPPPIPVFFLPPPPPEYVCWSRRRRQSGRFFCRCRCCAMA